MTISSAYSLFETQSVSPLVSENKKQAAPKSDSAGGDTVSISNEAKAMLAEMTRSLSEGKGTSSDTPQNKDSSPGAGGGAGGAGGAGNADGAGEAASSEDQLEDLEGQIAKLQSQYQSVMQGSAPEGVKEAQGQALQQQISALQQQVNELKMAALKKA